MATNANDPTKGDEVGKGVTTPPVKSTASPAVKLTPAPSKEAEADGPGEVDNRPSADKKELKIGTVKDGLRLDGTKPYKAPETREDRKEHEKEEMPITSLAQLRDEQIANNVPAVERVKQRDQVKKLEEDIEKEGAKHVRLSAAERGKVKK